MDDTRICPDCSLLVRFPDHSGTVCDQHTVKGELKPALDGRSVSYEQQPNGTWTAVMIQASGTTSRVTGFASRADAKSYAFGFVYGLRLRPRNPDYTPE